MSEPIDWCAHERHMNPARENPDGTGLLQSWKLPLTQMCKQQQLSGCTHQYTLFRLRGSRYAPDEARGVGSSRPGVNSSIQGQNGPVKNSH